MPERVLLAKLDKMIRVRVEVADSAAGLATLVLRDRGETLSLDLSHVAEIEVSA